MRPFLRNVILNPLSGFDPKSMRGLKFWFESDNAGNTIVSSAYAGLDDKSLNGWDLTQSDETRRPSIQASQLNGYTAMGFDGANDGFSFSGTQLDFARNSNGNSYVAIVQAGNTTANGYILNTTNPSLAGRFTLYKNNSAKFAIAARRTDSDTAAILTSTSSYNTSTWYWLEAIVNYATGLITLRINNLAEETLDASSTWAAASLSSNTASASITMGGVTTAPLNGKVHLAMGFSGVLTAPERASLRAYFTGKYPTLALT